jgi:ubiquinone/menaquinone biosynthesis C-methylase UbiE
VWRSADPELPAEIEPFSFLSAALLDHLLPALALAPGQTLVDLACGRGGPGLWLARQAGAALVGVDFSAVAVTQAGQRAELFGMADRARFTVGDLAGTGLADASADAAICVDAFHMAGDLVAAAGEAYRVLRDHGRLVLTNWQPGRLGDPRLPSRFRDIDWARILNDAGFADIEVEARTEWHEFFIRVYQTALGLGDPHDDTALAMFQDEARRRLPDADLFDRVVVTATRPPRQASYSSHRS